MRKPIIYLLLAHPDSGKSRINKILLAAIKDLENVIITDLYRAYPDFIIDVEKEQQQLLKADTVIFQFPFYWYSSPAILKEWQDKVLSLGFAYGKNGDKLKHKHFFVALSAGGSEEVYQAGGRNNFTVSEFLRPFQQTSHLCGMEYKPPFIVNSAYKQTDEQLEVYAQLYRNRLLTIEHLSY
jgi:glutathione-regulated potassium-efflux system ancillary protein KefG